MRYYRSDIKIYTFAQYIDFKLVRRFIDICVGKPRFYKIVQVMHETDHTKLFQGVKMYHPPLPPCTCLEWQRTPRGMQVQLDFPCVTSC